MCTCVYMYVCMYICIVVFITFYTGYICFLHIELYRMFYINLISLSIYCKYLFFITKIVTDLI